jgi:hypothetical protein
MRLVLPEVFQALTLALIAGGLLFAAVFGGRHERAAALVLVSGAVATWAAQGLGPERTPEVAFLLIDFGVVLGLLWVLVSSKLFWAGAACCAQMLLLMFTATRLVEFPLSEIGYIAMLQVSTVIVMVSLIYGTWAHRWGPKDLEPNYV